MQLILKEDIQKLGKSGELVTVKPGFGRNYLIPQGKAVLATKKSIVQLDHEKKLIAAKNAKLLKDAQSIADRISQLEVTVERAVGGEDKIFGSVTSRDVEEALAAKGVKVDRRKITLDPIKSLGIYTVDVKLTPDVSAKLKLWVVAKAPTA